MRNFVKGGTEKFAIALKDCAESYGAVIQTSKKVQSIDTDEHGCIGCYS